MTWLLQVITPERHAKPDALADSDCYESITNCGG